MITMSAEKQAKKIEDWMSKLLLTIFVVYFLTSLILILIQTLQRLYERFYGYCTVKVENSLDQDVYVQIVAHRYPEWDEYRETIGTEFVVSAKSSVSKTLTLDTAGYLPYLTVNVRCSTTPTEGAVSVFRIRTKDDVVKVVDALEIRDTSDHNPSTDPEKISWVEW